MKSAPVSRPTTNEPQPQRKLYAERPGWGPDFDYDEGRHLVAYQFARRLAAGKRLLDAGCGEGFCTQELADVAHTVVGVDYHAESVATARRKWQKPNLAFEVVDLTKDKPAAAPFDVVLNFQVLEHVEDDLGFVRNLASALAPGGTLMLTTPNAAMSFSENPCHLREYTAAELNALLGKVFAHVEMLGVFPNARVEAFDRERRRAVERILRLDPLNLRRLLPERIVHVAFARLGQLVRRQAHGATGGAKISLEDFEVRAGELERALDLVAVCRA
jgi:2-polyprenyl-3-methyl-5-hydroxy-6-metoxy-1,4-benzoquinol methylase